MAKKKTESSEKDNTLINQITSHYKMWTDDNDIRRTRKYGWDDITDAYYGRLPSDWPFASKVTDPRIRTTIIEKNARLVNGKLRGRLVPREGGDLVGAEINNTILDQQWDTANDGGSMNMKIAICDIDTRLYQSKFGLVKWKTERDDDKLLFDGNEFVPLDIRDCGMDPAASHIRDAKWFQHRAWEYVEDLEKQTDQSGEPIYQNLGTLKIKIKEKQSGKSSQRKNAYVSRVKTLRGLTDRVGEDIAFPIVELVTEYRKDRWITFSPEYKLIVRDIENPYKHGLIPVAQNRYYALQDDALGESEVETLIPLWRAINAVLCAYLDEVILKMRPPLKVIEGAVRIETLQYGPEAQILVTRPDAVTEMQSNGEAVRYFQTTYSALVSAFSTASGDLSQGTSGVDPFNPEKTATEVKATERQRNVRDQKNQNDLGDFIKDIMLMWCSNNKQFLFSDPKKKEHILRIVGKEKFAKFIAYGLDESILPQEVANELKTIIESNPDITDDELAALADVGKVPKYTVVENPDAPENEQKVKPKMRVDDTQEVAEISVVPEDLEGTYDYIPDIKSMASSYGDELAKARQNALAILTTNQVVLQLLSQEGYTPKVKVILESIFSDMGISDPEKFFEKIQIQPQINGQTQGAQGAAGILPGNGAPQQYAGVQGSSQAIPGAGPQQQMA